ncbi:nicotinate phosphoribosyltransferase [Pelomicrobium methylotrophicum]|uniref:Nicotinate phosphoribosyltransferase n=1 Tax=Pelomicrobium methylotrophicum TaxID=2602750 RepID=A0A5C7EV96_9PROT|nr:nicotinate phosphoribosyltransferase [Pelomicrobium methylotrophicum]TXF12231.1 nicotinate phosphoribosyltransferase [Pelomicrobium methylotrophicum]
MTATVSPLLTDLYQLTMLQAYVERGMNEVAVFELFVRKLPAGRNFLVAAGLEQALDYLENLRFRDEELNWVAESGLFKPGFVDFLAGLRFEGDVYAMPEGTLFFANEPVLRVVAPLTQAQLVETRLLNIINFQSMVAAKAARSVLVAQGKLLVDFGLRRAHGAEAGLFAARAAYLAGFNGTATVLAGQKYGIPLYGTMAHSFIQAHDGETQAFEAFARTFPGNAILLIDTYDTERAARRVVRLARRLASDGIEVRGVRIDSGDLARHAREVRRILDEGGLPKALILASGNLDEHKLAELILAGAPIDGFGIGTSLTTSSDAPSLDSVYKLQEYAGRARRKRSEQKATWPGRKQVYRRFARNGTMAGDVLTVETDRQAGEPLLVQVMAGGRRIAPPPALEKIRERTLAHYRQLPEALRGLDPAPPYPVEVAPALRALAEEVNRREESEAPA